MKSLLGFLAFALPFAALAATAPAPQGDYVETYDTIYNSLTVERKGNLVELRARARGTEALESAVDLSDPLKLVVRYTRSLYGALYLQPAPRRVMMVGLGGAGFHRLFAAAYPDSLLHTVELDPKVVELCETRMGFKPTDKTPVTVMDGRMFVKRNKEQWDWIVLDAFRGGFVPPHLKTEEFYRECAARLTDRGVFVSNLHASTALYFSDLKTIQKVFPQVVIFDVKDAGNVIVCAVKYKTPDVTNPSVWPTPAEVTQPAFAGRLNMVNIREELGELPLELMRKAKVMTDDFSPVEFLDTLKTNNADNKSH